MADEQVPGATPADQGATPDTDAPAPAPAATADAEQLGETGLGALKRERELREAAEKREKTLTVQLKKFQDADKSESERQAEEIAQLRQDLTTERTRAQEQRLEMASFAAARKLGFRNPEIAHRLLRSSEVEFTEDGTPRNVEQLLASIAKAEPYLVSSTTDYGGGPRGASPNAGVDMNARIRRATGRA